MKNLVHILDEIALASADVNRLSIQVRAAITANMEREARDKLRELIRVQRQVAILTNTVHDVVDAMDAAPVAEGDLEAARTVYQEA